MYEFVLLLSLFEFRNLIILVTINMIVAHLFSTQVLGKPFSKKKKKKILGKSIAPQLVAAGGGRMDLP